ncbi:MAG: hypothetical protein ACR2QF_04800, partial [Geminicoccaceae bacterium]
MKIFWILLLADLSMGPHGHAFVQVSRFETKAECVAVKEALHEEFLTSDATRWLKAYHTGYGDMDAWTGEA